MDERMAVVGISGGVDSAVCAAMLLERGYEVTGVYLETGCHTGEAARRVCEQLDIPLTIEYVEDELRERVMIPFAQSYCRGMTPNPCVTCNQTVKFPALLRAADRLGARYIATGHYARLTKVDGVTVLLKGAQGRDQSYMLYRLPQEILSRCIFPLGEEVAKDSVRARARVLGLEAAEAPDSMDVCFAQGDDYGDFIESMGYTAQEGDIVDTDGAVLGRHRGLHRYTVGQRRGLRVSSEERRFVVGLDPEQNRVVLGGGEQLRPRCMVVSQLVLAQGISLPIEADVRVRYGKSSAKALVTPLTGNRAEVRFTGEPARAPAPGQSAVFYLGDAVAGGGIIQRPQDRGAAQ